MLNPISPLALPMGKQLFFPTVLSAEQTALATAPYDPMSNGEREVPRARGLGEPSPEGEPSERGLGPDAGTGQVAGGPAGNVITMNLTGTAQAGALAWDQWWFFSLLADQPINDTYALGQVDVLTEDDAWTSAMVAMYLGLEPLFLITANITAVSTAAALAGMSLRARRTDPFGQMQGNLSPQAAYQNAADFQTVRGQFPIAEALDGWTWMRLIAPIQAAATTATVAWFFGPRTDRRAAVPRVSPAVVKTINR